MVELKHEPHVAAPKHRQIGLGQRVELPPAESDAAAVGTIQPSPKLAGFDKPLNAISYDYLTWTHKGLSDETVYKVAKAMYNNEQGLKDTSPLWRSHSSKTMAKDHGPETPYHPGAIKFYKEAGIWKR